MENKKYQTKLDLDQVTTDFSTEIITPSLPVPKRPKNVHINLPPLIASHNKVESSNPHPLHHNHNNHNDDDDHHHYSYHLRHAELNSQLRTKELEPKMKEYRDGSGNGKQHREDKYSGHGSGHGGNVSVGGESQSHDLNRQNGDSDSSPVWSHQHPHQQLQHNHNHNHQDLQQHQDKHKEKSNRPREPWVQQILDSKKRPLLDNLSKETAGKPPTQLIDQDAYLLVRKSMKVNRAQFMKAKDKADKSFEEKSDMYFIMVDTAVKNAVKWSHDLEVMFRYQVHQYVFKKSSTKPTQDLLETYNYLGKNFLDKAGKRVLEMSAEDPKKYKDLLAFINEEKHKAFRRIVILNNSDEINNASTTKNLAVVQVELEKALELLETNRVQLMSDGDRNIQNQLIKALDQIECLYPHAEFITNLTPYNMTP